ncbi:MAG TPA: lysophospholipid acyltransferase family protein [bacterium]
MKQFEAEAKPVLYRFIRVIVKIAMAIFFQKIELRNGESVPARGPVVFVANHPNSIMDALVMGAVTKRKVNYIGHAGLFSNKLKSWFLRSCGVIPVYRREDAPDKMEQNVAAFESCFEALENGETIGIFPEGTSDMLRKVKRVKTGAARIVLEAERRNGYQLGVTVLPIGLYFFSRSRFRSKVMVNVGKPIALTPFFETNERSNAEAVQQLTAEIQQHLEHLTVNIQHQELDQFVRDIEWLYRDELKADAFPDSRSQKAAVTEFILTQRIAECVEYYFSHQPERVREMQEKINAYKRKLNRLHLKDNMLKETQNFWQLLRASFWTFMKALIGFPVAAYGVANNFIPYLISESFAKKFIDERTKILSALFIGGSLVFIGFYAVQAFTVWYFSGPVWSSLYLLSLPITGLFALAYIKDIRQEQERISFSFFLFTNRQLFFKMRRERKLLIAEMDQIKNEYLNLMGRPTQIKERQTEV